MTTAQHIALGAILGLFLAQVVHAQASSLNEGSARSAIQSGNLAQLVSLADDACRGVREAAVDKSLKVSVRADSAAAALWCGRTVAAAIVAISPPDRASQTRDLLNTWLAPQEVRARQADAEASFLGLKWGVGIGISRSWDTSIDDADVVNGTVRVISDGRDQPRVLLEFHKYLWCNENQKVGTRGCGPFVAASATDGKLLSGVGLGFMYGVKAQADESDGFSIGIGAVLDGRVKDLGVGFRADEAPPVGETVVRYTTRGRWASVLFVTRTF